MSKMLLTDLHLHTGYYGEVQGRLIGKATFKGQSGEVSIELNQEKASAVVALLADVLVATAKETAAMMVQQIVDQTRPEPAPKLAGPTIDDEIPL